MSPARPTDPTEPKAARRAVRDGVARRTYELRHGAVAERAALAVEAWDLPGEPLPLAEALEAARFQPCEVGRPWGPPWGTTWFRLTGAVPPQWAGRPVEVHLDLGFSEFPPGFQAEGLVVRPDGVPLQGVHPRQRALRLSDAALGGELVALLVEAAANPTVTSFTAGAPEPDPAAPQYVLRQAELVVPRDDVLALVHDLEALDAVLALGRSGGADDARLAEVVAALAAALDRLADGTGDPAAVDPATVAAARAELAPALATAPPPHGRDGRTLLTLVGHAHLDTAWLWPVRESVRKVGRTVANVLALMRREPGWVFAGSQAAQHAWVRDHYPALWPEVAARVSEGRWVPVGGMWVEADTLLPSGESLVRQLVHGQRFFRDELGRAARTGWLPDCFGFTPALPQLLRQAGIDAFLTQKLSWNDTNRFPHATFWWEGLDGSRVLAHFPPVDTYNAELSADDLVRAVRAAPSGAPVPDVLVPFGHGDGGGGPTAAMLARAARLRDLDGAPAAAPGDPDGFFAGLDREGLPTWSGELYLETHRGVWTSQHATKVGDAEGDEALRQAETWCATAAVRAGHPYPYDVLDALWRRHLLLQFHDILPGTSIGRVHREAEAEHAAVRAATLALRDAALAALGRAAGTTVDAAVDAAAEADVPAEPDDVAPRFAPAVGETVLDNGRLRVRFDAEGHPVSVHDVRADRELLPDATRLGLLQLHPDEPAMFDAWNLDRSYLDAVEDLTAAESVEASPRQVRVTRRFGRSAVTSVWQLPEDRARLDLRLEVDWREDDRVLKVAWPLQLRAQHHAAGVQLGLVERPLHANTSWEQARFEQWFHGFLHVAEGRYGVAVVAPDVHGYDARTVAGAHDRTTTLLRLTLLRAPRFPDPACDRGVHRFTVSLLADAGLVDATQVAVAARQALVPPPPHPAAQLVAVTGEGVVLDAVKLADDRSGDLVVRLHEAVGASVRARVEVAVPVVAASTCDLLEQSTGGLEPRDGVLMVPLGPFEVVTLRARPLSR